VGRDSESYSLIWISEKQKYFCKQGWTSASPVRSLICPSGNRIEVVAGMPDIVAAISTARLTPEKPLSPVTFFGSRPIRHALPNAKFDFIYLPPVRILRQTGGRHQRPARRNLLLAAEREPSKLTRKVPSIFL
jgi:hypothetical protein